MIFKTLVTLLKIYITKSRAPVDAHNFFQDVLGINKMFSQVSIHHLVIEGIRKPLTEST